MDVRVWLESLGQGEYAQAFIDNHIDATTLPRLTAEDLKEIGVQYPSRVNLRHSQPCPECPKLGVDRTYRRHGPDFRL